MEPFTAVFIFFIGDRFVFFIGERFVDYFYFFVADVERSGCIIVVLFENPSRGVRGVTTTLLASCCLNLRIFRAGAALLTRSFWIVAE